MLTQFNSSGQNMPLPAVAITQAKRANSMSQTATVKSDQFSLHCEADNECDDDEEDEASSLTASHKSDHY